MAYRNQNYMTNKKIKAAVDKNQKNYISKEEPEIPIVPEINNTYGVILDKTSFENELNNADSGLSRYYNKYPREDGIDANGDPVRDPDTEIVGHSWESAITAPTDPKETSSFPWIDLAFNTFDGTMEIKYDGETKLTETVLPRYSLWIISVPNDLGMTDYRLEWGTGATGIKEFDPELLDIIFTPNLQE